MLLNILGCVGVGAIFFCKIISKFFKFCFSNYSGNIVLSLFILKYSFSILFLLFISLTFISS